MKWRGVACRLLGAIALAAFLTACNFLSRDDLNDLYARGSSQIGYLLQRFPKDSDRGDREWAEAAAIRWCFDYWLSARGPRAFHDPIPFYERHMALSLWRPVKQNKMIDDPLGIRGTYTDGSMRPNVIFPMPNAMRRGDVDQLNEYERLINGFKDFFASAEAEGERWEQGQAKLRGRSHKDEGREGSRGSTKIIIVEPAHPAEPSQSSGR